MSDISYVPLTQPATQPLTVGDLASSLPALQAAQIKANRLKQVQAGFQGMADQPGNPNFLPTQNGGLYQTVAKYMPDYAGAANKMVGTLGSYLTQNEQDKQQKDDLTRNTDILQAADQMGRVPQAGAASPNALRAYLSLIGGDQAKEIIGNTPHVSSTQTDSEGNTYTVMSDGNTYMTGRNKDYKGQVVNIPGQAPFLIGTSGAGRGKMIPTTAPGAPVPGGVGAPVPGGVGAPAPGGVGAPGGGQPQLPPIPPGGSMSNDDVFRRMLHVENPTGDINATSPTGNFGPSQLGESTADEMEKLLHLPPGSTRTDANANLAAGRARYDQMFQKYGDQRLATMAYNWGPGAMDNWLHPPPGSNQQPMDWSKVPKETQNYVATVFGGSPNVDNSGAGGAAAPNGQPTVPINPSDYQRGAASEQGKIDVQTKMAPQIAEAARQKKAAEDDATNRGKVLAALPHMKNSVNEVLDTIKQLRDAKGLGDITGSSVMGRIPDDDPRLQGAAGALFAGSNAADLMALHNKLAGGAFMAAFNDMRSSGGGVGRVTEYEAKKAQDALAALARNQSTPKYRAALDTLANVLTTNYQGQYDYGHGGGPAIAIPNTAPAATQTAGAGAAAPAAGGLSDEDILKKYSGT
jgi:hypothetical protein